MQFSLRYFLNKKAWVNDVCSIYLCKTRRKYKCTHVYLLVEERLSVEIINKKQIIIVAYTEEE